MLGSSLGAAWFAWQIGPPVGFCAEPRPLPGRQISVPRRPQTAHAAARSIRDKRTPTGSLTRQRNRDSSSCSQQPGLYRRPPRPERQLALILLRRPIGEAGGVNLYAYVGGSPVSYLDSQGTTPIGVVVGFIGGLSFGTISSLIEGKSLEAALINGGEDAVVGGLIGLTDGLSLVPILTRGAINGSAEAIKEEVHGCGPDSKKIFLAVAVGALGDIGGQVAEDAISSAATQASHYVIEAAGWVAPAVGTALSGSNEVFQSFLERTSHF